MTAVNLTLTSLTQNTMDHNEDQQSLNSSTIAAGEVVFVHVYSVVACFAALLFLLSVGALSNIVVILVTGSSRCHSGANQRPCKNRDWKRLLCGNGSSSSSSSSSSRILRRLDVRSLCVVSLFVCVFLAPLEFATVVENCLLRSIPSVVCYLVACSFHLFLTVSVCCLAVLVMEEVVEMSVMTTRMSPSEEKQKCALGHHQQKKTAGATVWAVARGANALLTPWLLGIGAAAMIAYRLEESIDYKIGVSQPGVLYYVSDYDTFGSSSLPRLTAALSVGYLFVLGASLSALTYAIRRIKKNQTDAARRSTVHEGEGQPDAVNNCDQESAALHDRSGGGADGSPNAPRRCGGGGGGEDGNGSRRSIRRLSNGSVQSDRRRDVSRPVSQESINTGGAAAAALPSPRKALRKQMAVGFGGLKSSQQQSQRDDNEAEDDNDDDDTFDMKMRLRFQKKSRSNSRRHTVANIGLPDISSLRSVFDNCGGNQKKSSNSGVTGSGGGRPTPDNYHYVRKWSVDITALANQLENPKAHTGSYPILRERSVTENLLSPEFNTGKTRGSIRGRGVTNTGVRLSPREVEKKSNDSPVELKNSRRTRLNGGDAEVIEKDTNSIFQKEEKKCDILSELPLASSAPVQPKAQCQSTPAVPVASAVHEALDNPIVILDEVDATDGGCVLEPPSIVVSVTTDDEDVADANIPLNANSLQELGKHCLSSSKPTSVSSFRSAYSAADDHGCGAGGGSVRNDVKATHRQLMRVRRTAVLVLLALLMTLPYAVVSVIDSSTSGHEGIHRLYNARLVASAIAMLQSAVFPLVIVWADRSLRVKLRRWWKSALRLRCVCYCNVGPGKSCCSVQRQPPQLNERKRRATSPKDVSRK